MPDGTIIDKKDYEPFGKELLGNQARLGYIGKGKDSESSLNDHGVRKYDPEIGRFTSCDPLAEKYYSLTPYQYSNNNPVCFKDDDGKEIYTVGTESGISTYWRKNDLEIFNAVLNKMKDSEQGRVFAQYIELNKDFTITVNNSGSYGKCGGGGFLPEVFVKDENGKKKVKNMHICFDADDFKTEDELFCGVLEEICHAVVLALQEDPEAYYDKHTKEIEDGVPYKNRKFEKDAKYYVGKIKSELNDTSIFNKQD